MQLHQKDTSMNRERFIQAMLASASVPVVMEATLINNEVCYDGGVRDLLPFSEAIELGAEVIVPIFLSPEEFGRTENRFRRLDKILLRTLDILLDEASRNDIDMAELVNIGVKAKEDLNTQFNKDKVTFNKIKAILNKKEYKDLFGSDKRLLKIITGIRPDFPLTDDSLSFDPVKMKQWVDLGEHKASQVITQSPFV